MPPPRKARKKAALPAAAAASGRDRISALPDDALLHVLSFLPAHDAAGTRVLARRWRHLWKSTAALRIRCGGDKEPATVSELAALVEHLLRLRIHGGPPIDTCEFRLDSNHTDDLDMSPRLNSWIRQALQCKARVLHLSIRQDRFDYFELEYRTLVSQHLKKLELHGIDFSEYAYCDLDLSSCPVLEDLEMHNCFLSTVDMISSKSVERMSIDYCVLLGESRGRMEICAPNLVRLWLQNCEGRIPSLVGMPPSLVGADIKINSTHGGCLDDLSEDCDNEESSCPDKGGEGGYKEDCFSILGKLSETQHLALILANIPMFTFRRYFLEFCPRFSKLKALVLNDYWCHPAVFSALDCLLKNSPILEKITIQLHSEGPKDKLEIKLSCRPVEISAAVSEHLKIVEIKCNAFDQNLSQKKTRSTRMFSMF